MSDSSQSILREPSLGSDEQQCLNYPWYANNSWRTSCQGQGGKRKSLTLISHSIEDESDHQKEEERRIISLNQAIAREEEESSRDDDDDILRLASQLERTGPRRVKFDTETMNQTAPEPSPFKRRRYMRRNSFVIHRNQQGGAGSTMLGMNLFNSTPSSLCGTQEESRTPEKQDSGYFSQDTTMKTSTTVQHGTSSSGRQEDTRSWLNSSPMSFDSKPVIAKPLVGKSPLGSDDLTMKAPEIRLPLKKSTIRLPASGARLFMPRGA